MPKSPLERPDTQVAIKRQLFWLVHVSRMKNDIASVHPLHEPEFRALN